MAKKKLYKSGLVYSTDPEAKISVDEDQERETIAAKEQLLTVRIDAKHRGGKIVTLIEGFYGSTDDLEKLGKQLKSYCGTGGSVKNNEILIQGDNREKVLQWLHKNGYLKTKKI